MSAVITPARTCPALNVGAVLGIGPPTAHLPIAEPGMTSLFVPEPFSLQTLLRSPITRDLLVCHDGAEPSFVESGAYDIRFYKAGNGQGPHISPALAAAAWLCCFVLGEDLHSSVLLCKGAYMQWKQGKLHVFFSPASYKNMWGADVQMRDPAA